MESGTDCSLSERFWAVTVIVSNSLDDAGVSAAGTRIEPSNAAKPAKASKFFDIPTRILPAKPIFDHTPRLAAWRKAMAADQLTYLSIGPNSFVCQKELSGPAALRRPRAC
ncbi:MAG: hypothetical protein NVS9B2_03790 [Steroidobacteraceae bacterium]